MLNWSSRNQRSYQRIDDEYEDGDQRTSTCNTILPIVSTGRNMLFGGGPRNSESSPLISGSSTPGDGYHSPPSNHAIGASVNDENGRHTPPVMSSSTRHSAHRWDHIENLDRFFTLVYEYHQGGGFLTIAVKKAFSLVQFVFVVTFSTFFLQCIDYEVLFANKNMTTTGEKIVGKRSFDDAIVENCASHLHPLVVFSILVATVFWILRVVKTTYYLLELHEIQLFYRSALLIKDAQLSNLKWHDVVQRICEVQKHLHLKVDRDNITPFDLYNRILRFKNYLVALVNTRVLPPVLNVPFIGPVPYLPNGLKSNLRRILFFGSTSPWAGPYLKDEYKDLDNLEILTRQMEKDVAMYGFLNLVFFPLIFLYQILYAFFTLSELIKRRRDALGMRRYSNYGRYRLRHFNELNHELATRLNRSHIHANAYMNQFTSALTEILAKNVAFIAGAIAGVLAILSAWDEDVLQAHTEQVRREFEQLFQLKWMFLLQELSSPILTPFILLFWIRPNCRELVRFFHDNTVRVDGLGDVCSYALMDVARHGDVKWNGSTSHPTAAPAMDGKTELSILHFASNNPEWKCPPATEQFLQRFRSKLEHDVNAALQPVVVGDERNLLLDSMHSIMPTIRAASHRNVVIGDGLYPAHVAPDSIVYGLLPTLYQTNPQGADSLTRSLQQSGIDLDSAGADMRIKTLFLREMHEESLRRSSAAIPSYGASVAGVHAQSVFGVPQLSQMEESVLPESDARSRLMLRPNLPGTNEEETEEESRRQQEEEEERRRRQEDDDNEPPPHFMNMNDEAPRRTFPKKASSFSMKKDRYMKKARILGSRSIVRWQSVAKETSSLFYLREAVCITATFQADLTEEREAPARNKSKQKVADGMRKAKNGKVKNGGMKKVKKQHGEAVKGTCIEHKMLGGSMIDNLYASEDDLVDVSDMIEDVKEEAKDDSTTLANLLLAKFTRAKSANLIHVCLNALLRIPLWKLVEQGACGEQHTSTHLRNEQNQRKN
ncbi:Autophagy protein 9 [Trichostrongylus colubriformis]|uniref:Autophagy-related protein 9 n=1 Tax=Trichostrongylus colubriformis TaxID=6319 RepID=A0AAN8FDG3_TRICO